MATELANLLQPTITAFGWALLHSLWQISLIAAIYKVLVKGIGGDSPQRRLGLGYLALLSMAVWPASTLITLLRPEVNGVTGTVSLTGPPSVVTAVIAAEPSFLASAAEAQLPWLVAFWGCGVVVLTLHAAWRWHKLYNLCRQATPLTSPWIDVANRWRQKFGMRMRVTLCESAEVCVPLLLGWLRPTILLPAGMCLRLSPAQLELIIAHELAHIRRWDTFANALQLVIETLLFHHPLVHWVSQGIHADRELCCDDIVAAHGGDRLHYAKALLAAAEMRREAISSRLVLAATGGSLTQRISRLVGERMEKTTPSSSPFIAPRLLLGAMLALLMIKGLSGLHLAQNAEAFSTFPLPISAIQWSARSALFPAAQLRIDDLPLARTIPRRESQLLQPEQVAEARMAPMLAPEFAITNLPLEIRPTLSVPSAAEDRRESAQAQALQREFPVYPRAAVLQGWEGQVELSFRIDQAGKVQDIKVESAIPAGIFEQAAINALYRWRFASGSNTLARQHQLFSFTLPQTRGKRNTCEARTGTRICRERSQYELQQTALGKR